MEHEVERAITGSENASTHNGKTNGHARMSFQRVLSLFEFRLHDSDLGRAE
jgi:hypothetical protein